MSTSRRKNSLILVVIAMIISAAVAHAQRFNFDGFSYEIKDETHVWLKGLAKDENGGYLKDPKDLREIIVPYYIETSKGNYIVSGVYQLAFAFCGIEYLEKVTIIDGDEPLSVFASAFGYASIENFYQGRNLEWANKERLEFGRNESALKTLVVGDCVTKIMESQFEYCKTLESVILGENIEIIERSAFRECSSLKSIKYPSTLKEIGSAAFSGCESLPEFTIPEGITELHSGVFYQCSSLSSITIPSAVKSIEGSAFGDCPSLTDVIIEDSDEAIDIDGTAFGRSYNIQNLYLGRDIVEHQLTLGFNLGGKKSSLTNLTIGDKVTSIQKKRFIDCRNLQVIDLGRGMSSIGDEAFGGCTGIKKIIVRSDIPPVFGKPYFSDEQYSSIRVFIPDNSITKYNTAPCWEKFQLYSDISTPESIYSFEVKLYPSDMVLAPKESATIGASVLTELTTNKSLRWESSDEKVAQVNGNGTVTALKDGVATITAYTIDGADHYATCEVVVREVRAQSITLSVTELIIDMNSVHTLIATVEPDNTTYPEITWESSDESVATVDNNGVITAVGVGEAVIMATCGEVNATCKVTVTDNAGIASVSGDGVKVTASTGVVTVAGASVGDIVEVYSMSGACIVAKAVESSVEEIPVAASGVYVVRVAGKTFKVAL